MYAVTKKSGLTDKRTFLGCGPHNIIIGNDLLHQLGGFALRDHSVLQCELFWEIKIMRKNMKSDIGGDKEVIRTASF